ncbi:proteasome subunit beta type-1 [Skeletonema marinoi]|uniref:Proteasome subunit beta type-1 n=1 Tax=Skeletonema marinoi TaxID=267567 RepID=A0AAD8Y4Q3_9STRA|nr:proteasome subunit beta type-1 [Skeletonema marinoi]
MTMKPFSKSNPLASIILLSTLLLLTTFPTTTAQKFDPYQLNGGLVAAVAGRDYVLIASDTRLTDGGYGVHSRRYLSGRLWSASTSSSVVEVADPLLSSSGGDDIMTLSKNNDLIQPPSTITTSNVHWDSNGSLQLPNIISPNSASSSSLHTIEPTNAPPTTTTTNPPIMIGSAGCASDCESLKRRVRLELDALTMNNNNNNNSNSKLGVASVANLLQQILYSRRGFPFYSFCVVAGLHPPQELVLRGSDGGGKKRMEGAVYVYDAIGSYERVAVGSAGTGRELLQPILDQLFSDSTTTITSKEDDPSITINNNDNHSNNGKSGDIMAIPPMKQRVGVAGSLRPPVQTVVRCSVEDAVRNVARAYQSVAEREISVGDEVVICVVKSCDVVASSAGDGGRRSEGAVLKVYRYPLKKH